MRNFLLTTCVGAVAVFAMGAAHANDELIKMSQNPKDWVMPTGNYANHRYSQLKQITAQNVGKLQVAWTFSTGVLRGHEGGPLVIGNVMYVMGRSRTRSTRSTSTTTPRSSGNTSPSRIRTSFR